MKLWGGRFNKKSSQLLDEFNNSITFDYVLYEYDIKGSIAHIKMLNKIGVVNNDELEMIIEALNEIKDDINHDKINFEIEDEDIHMAIEKELIKKVGDVGKKLHTARSRNDQIALDMKLYLKEELEEIKLELIKLLEILNKLSEKYIDVYMPGYTHLQGAQIITLGFYLQAYFQKFKRDYERVEELSKRIDYMPLGTGALAGVNYANDREFLAEELGFKHITVNALDTVSDRDYIVEFLSISSMIILHLSRFCEEIIIYSSQQFKFIELDDAFTTGSSIMPQKKNPDVAELIRGKSGKVFGNLIGLLNMLKGLPLAYNKDMQEDKKYMFESVEVIKDSLEIFSEMILTAKFNENKMKAACEKGYLNATDIADYLVNKGLEFRKSHEVVGSIVKHLEAQEMTFKEMSLESYKQFSDLFEQDIYEVLKLENAIAMKKSKGSTSIDSIKEMIIIGNEWLDEVTK